LRFGLEVKMHSLSAGWWTATTTAEHGGRLILQPAWWLCIPTRDVSLAGAEIL
jgi:hypothetical protein